MNKGKEGLTIIELLVTVSLIGVLAVVLVSIISPLGNFQKARNAQRRSDIEQIKRMLELYYNDNGAYPCVQSASPSNSNSPCPGTGIAPKEFILTNAGSSNVYPAWSASYASVVPEDPTAGGSKCPASSAPSKSYSYSAYTTSGTPQGYTIFFQLEGNSDPDIAAPKPAPLYTNGGTCNTPGSGGTCVTFTTANTRYCSGRQYNDWINVP